MAEYLFVYGTLMKAGGHAMAAHLTRHGRCAGPATFRGRLYRVAAYPGALASAQAADVVHGELHELTHSDALFALLDAYEGCSADDPQPHEYIRVQCSVSAGAKPLNAWVYLYNRPVTGLARIASGRFVIAQ